MREKEVRQTLSEKSSTIFADNLRVGIRKVWVYNLFSKYGKIREVFIPNKRSKITNQSFGLVRFCGISEATLAIAKIHDSWCRGKKLMVKYARFLRIQDRQGEQQSNKGDGYQRNFRGDHWKSSNPKKYSGRRTGSEILKTRLISIGELQKEKMLDCMWIKMNQFETGI